MANLNFPNPTVETTYTEAGITWTWNQSLKVWSTEGSINGSGDGGGDGGDGGDGFSGNYNDLTNKPIIGDGVISIKDNGGTSFGSFDVNQTEPQEIVIPRVFSGNYNDLTDKPSIDGDPYYTYPGGVERTVDSRLTDVKSVKDFGAKGDGIQDDREAIQAAINSSELGPVYFPSGKYKIDGTLYLPEATKLLGCTSGQAATDQGSPKNASMLEFVGTATGPKDACITSADQWVSSNMCLENLTIRANVGTYTNVFYFPRLHSSVINNIKAQNIHGGVFKGYNDPDTPSTVSGATWTNRFFGCTFGSSDGVDAYVMDIDFSDSYFTDCYFSSGRGVIDRTTGGNLYKGCHFERTRFDDNFAALTITRHYPLHRTSGACQKTFTGCYFDENHTNIRLDPEIGSLRPPTPTPNPLLPAGEDLVWGVVVTGCLFRCAKRPDGTKGRDIEMLDAPNGTRGGVFIGNTFSGSQHTSLYRGSGWEETSFISNSNVGAIDLVQLGKQGFFENRESIFIRRKFLDVTGSFEYNDTANLSAAFGTVTGGPKIALGTYTGNTPFIAASRNSDSVPAPLQIWIDDEGHSVFEPGAFRPRYGNAISSGAPGYGWSVVYSNTGAINTSDINTKQDIRSIESPEKRVAVTLKGLIKAFRFKDAYEKKGDNARIHYGVMAQDVENAFKAEGLDPEQYALFCKDEDEDGNEIYGIRYSELLIFILSTL